MKKTRVLLCVILALALLLTACSGKDETPSREESSSPDPAPEDLVAAEKLTLLYAPSMDAQVILKATEPLKQLLADELAARGFAVEVEIAVGETFGAVGQAVAAGSADIGIGGSSIYLADEAETQLLLTATRYGFNRDANPRSWNQGETERDLTRQVAGQPGLIYAGPSAKGKALAAKVEAGEPLTWEDLNGAAWAVGGNTSDAGYLYPDLWLRETCGKPIADLSNALTNIADPDMFAQAAAGKIDVFVSYADARSGFVDAWTGEMGRSGSVWDEVKVIGVTPEIMNDVVIGSKTSATMSIPGFPEAFCEAMQAVAETEEGFAAIQIFSHVGYLPGNPDNFAAARQVAENANTLS